jgi:hypothetical protein
MTTTTLSKFEETALVSKSRRNTFGRVSDRLISGLIEKGLVDGRTRRLTEDGISMVEVIRRSN